MTVRNERSVEPYINVIDAREENDTRGSDTRHIGPLPLFKRPMQGARHCAPATLISRTDSGYPNKTLYAPELSGWGKVPVARAVPGPVSTAVLWSVCKAMSCLELEHSSADSWCSFASVSAGYPCC